jgi:hypothetical protein
MGINPNVTQKEIDYMFQRVSVKMPFHYKNFHKAISRVLPRLVTNKSKCDKFYEDMLDEARTDSDPLDALLVGVGIDRDSSYFLETVKVGVRLTIAGMLVTVCGAWED